MSVLTEAASARSGRRRIPASPVELSQFLSWFLDLLALAALGVAVENIAWVASAGFAVALAFGFRTAGLRSQLFLAGMILLVVGMGMGAYEGFGFTPIVVVSWATPWLHALVWLLPGQSRKRPLRLALGVLELILAASLTDEFYLFLMIFAFFVIGAVTAACDFLAQELARRAPGQEWEPLPQGFVGRVTWLSFAIFLSGLVIFPLLPRLHWKGGAPFDFSQLGYTEEVTLNDKLKVEAGGDEPALWFYPRGGEDLGEEIFLGLVRGRELGRFDGTHWTPLETPRRSQGLQSHGSERPSGKDARKKGEVVEVDALRGPLGSPILPVPYGTIDVAVDSASDPSSASAGTQNTASGHGSALLNRLGGAWLDPYPGAERGVYHFRFRPYSFREGQSSDTDHPLPAHLAVPTTLRSERMLRLVHMIFAGASSARQKADQLLRHFRAQHFRASYGDPTDDLVRGSTSARRFHPLERFLFLTQEGHCEWFASSSAILLRLAGVPTRLVAGFRLTHSQVGGVLTVRRTDGHAWLEFWDDERGWLPLDPTPREEAPPGWMNSLRDRYDWISGYWFKYILSFHWKAPSAAGLWKVASRQARLLAQMARASRIAPRIANAREWVSTQLRMLFLGFAFLGTLGFLVYRILLWRFPWLGSIRYRVREGEPRLRKERKRMERAIERCRARGADEAALAEWAARWARVYQEARFGRPMAKADRVKQLGMLRKICEERILSRSIA